MSKKTSDGEVRITGLTNGERTPPLLSEKLIAKLQGAVEVARRDCRNGGSVMSRTSKSHSASDRAQ
jgi:hypothetical protein